MNIKLSKNRKGDKSLEMIIGLMILLVVAAVVIKLFLNYVNPEKVPTAPEEELAKKSFYSECETLCTKAMQQKSLEYCTTYFKGNDWNHNGIPNEKITVGATAFWDVCEDRIYCFHVVDCSSSDRKIGINECKQLLCNAAEEKYGNNPTLKTNYLNGLIQPGSCDLESKVSSEDYWYNRINTCS